MITALTPAARAFVERSFFRNAWRLRRERRLSVSHAFRACAVPEGSESGWVVWTISQISAGSCSSLTCVLLLRFTSGLAGAATLSSVTDPTTRGFVAFVLLFAPRDKRT